ncbi:hypothetical protein J2R76_000688 [Bradyrhizobium sp. USDA 4532]|nr:hypothetical protein [Bradyrhizobium sp. USDA 4545]MCP1917097.1 hypothetical protein [Bradyrhizobium sp. USDA 4532]
MRARIADLARQSQNQGLNRAGEKRSRPRVGPTAKGGPRAAFCAVGLVS